MDDTDNSPSPWTQPPNPPTYAQKAAQAPPPQPSKQTRKVPAKEPAKSRPDSRLFIRLSPNYKARKPGPFIILITLKELLGIDSALI